MINLSATSDKIECVSGSAVTLDVHASYVEVVTATGAIVAADRKNTAISTATTTDITGSPGSSNSRNIKTVNIANKDASLSCDVTIQFNQGGTAYRLFKCTLKAGDVLEYVEGIGWFVVPATTSLVGDSYVYLTGDVSAFTTTTVADISGYNFAVKNGVYYKFHFGILYQAAATTTGIKLTVTIPTATSFSAVVDTPVSTSADGTANIYRGHITSSGDAVTGTGTPAATTTHLAEIVGALLPSADGTLQVQGASEVAASNVTVKQGSFGVLTRLSA